MSYGIIYKAANTANGKVYIGQTTKPLAKRKGGHTYLALKGGCCTAYFHLALNKYGLETFTWEQIDAAESQEELDRKEELWIAFFNSQDKSFGYNIRSGGAHGTLTDEARKKISASRKGIASWNKGKKLSFEHCQHLRDAHIGKALTEEHIQKISKALKGVNDWMKGRKLSDEAKQKISTSNQGKHHGPLSEEHRRKLSEAHKGKRLTAEQRKMISLRLIGRPMSEKCKIALWEGRKKSLKYPVETVIKIKRELQEGTSMCEVAQKYGIAYATIKAIKYGRAYRHIQIPA